MSSGSNRSTFDRGSGGLGNRRLRRLYVEQTLGWAIAWLIGVASLFFIAVTTHGRLSRQDLDAELSLFGIAVYGLTWFDEEGAFHTEDLRGEPWLLEGTFDIWVLEPGAGATHLAPSKPRFQIESLEAIADHIIKTEQEYFSDGVDAQGVPYRLQGIATYGMNDEPLGAILVAGDPQPWQAAHARFIREMALVVLALTVVGLGIGILLSRRALQPVIKTLEQQQRFLAAAAHELRTPVASLRAVCESAPAGDEADALRRVSRLVGQTGHLVDKLLLLARLDSAAAIGPRQPVRLDLLAEAVLPEDGSVDFNAVESIVEAEPILLETALRNLVENARIHGVSEDGVARVRVTVQDHEVVIEDRGSGFPNLLDRATEPFVARPGSPGTGLGLAIVDQIAQRHDGRLILENREDDGSGARLTLRIGSGNRGG